MALHKTRKVSGKYLVPGTRGPKLIKSTLDDAMQRLKTLMKARGITSIHHGPDGPEDEESDLFWTLHDL